MFYVKLGILLAFIAQIQFIVNIYMHYRPIIGNMWTGDPVQDTVRYMGMNSLYKQKPAYNI